MKKPQIKTKHCPRCEKIRATKNFYKNSASKDGYAHYCINCTKEYQKEWRERDPKQFSELRKEYRKQHKKRIKDYHREYYSRPEIRERTTEYFRQYRKKNKEKLKIYYQEYGRKHYAQNKDKWKAWYEKNKARISQKRKAKRQQGK